jgi:hypothetical protein
VLVDSLPARRLECSFHRHNSIFLYFVFRKIVLCGVQRYNIFGFSKNFSTIF